MNGCGFIPLIFYNSPLVIAVAAARAIADAAVQGHDAGHKSVVFFSAELLGIMPLLSE